MEDLRVLVAYSSIHGSTAEIARAVALTLYRTGLDVDVLPVSDVNDVSGYDSVVLGSAVYGGRWRMDAVAFLSQFSAVLAKKEVWLFQSGPLGHSAQRTVEELPFDVAMIAEQLHVNGHVTFGGKHDGTVGGPAARFLSRAGFVGDYRDFGKVRTWAEEVARASAMRVVMARTGRGACGTNEVVARK